MRKSEIAGNADQGNFVAGAEVRAKVYERLGSLVAALGSPVRLKIIQMLTQAPRAVEELSRLTGESVANTSQHLQKMAREGLVTFEKQGLTKVYRASSPAVISLWESIQELGRELSTELFQAEDALTDTSLHADLSAAEVLEAVRSRKAVLLDVRPADESAATPMPLSLVVPLERLSTSLGKLPARKTIYVFCRGRYCSMASDAVRILRKKGLKAFRLRESSFGLNSIVGTLQ